MWLLYLVLSSLNSSQASSASAKCFQKVVENLQIQKVSDLDFGTDPVLSPAKTVMAGTANNGSNASFKITGDKNRVVQVVLPADNTVQLTLISPIQIKTPMKTYIAVDKFTANILNGALDTNGQLDLYVGATREELALNQATGNYEGSFTVNVVY